MKQKIDRLKTGTARFSTRTLAMVLSVVMLISAIGTGSVLNAFAVGQTGSAIANALKSGADIADDVDEVKLTKKGDADLAGTGAISKWYIVGYDGTAADDDSRNLNSWKRSFQDYSISSNSGTIEYDSENTSSGNIYFRIVAIDDGGKYAMNVPNDGTTSLSYNTDYTLSWDDNNNTYKNYDKFDSAGDQLQISKSSGIQYVDFIMSVVSGANHVTIQEYNKYTVNVYSEDSTNKGTVSNSGSSTVKSYQSKTYTATPKSGYTFKNWEVVSGSVPEETNLNNASITLTPTANVELKAVFSYNVSITAANGGSYGTVSTDPENLTGLYGNSNLITVTASPASDYHVVWPEGFIETATNVATVTVSKAESYTIPFVKDQYELTANPADHGTYSLDPDDSPQDWGTSISVTGITPDEGYMLDTIVYNDGTDHNITAYPTFVLGKTATSVTVTFKEIEHDGITVSAESTINGTDYSAMSVDSRVLYIGSSGSQSADDVKQVTGIAIVAPATVTVSNPDDAQHDHVYTFKRWVVTGGTLGSAATVSTNNFKPTQADATAVAQYNLNYTVTPSTTGDGTGTISPSTPQSVPAGDTITFTLTPDADNGLSSILVNGTEKLLSAHLSGDYSFTTDPIVGTTSVEANFEPTILATAQISNKKYKEGETNDTTDRLADGSGTISVNAAAGREVEGVVQAQDTVITGADVTFTAVPADGYAFGGWYTDANCHTLLSSSATTVVPYNSATTYYAAFVKEHYYLTGEFFFANYAAYHKEDHDSTTYSFVQSATNPAEFVYTNDFMFKYNAGYSTNHLQFVSVGDGSKMYSTGSEHASSGTMAYDLVSTDNNYRWGCGDKDQDVYPPTGLNNCYKRVTFTWNAITETLSWSTPQDVNLNNYAVMYIRSSTTYKFDYLWVKRAGGDVALTATDKSIKLLGIPYIVDDNDTPDNDADDITYNVLLVSNSTLGSDELGFILSNNIDINADGVTKTDNLGHVYAGGKYTVDTSVAGQAWDGVCQDEYYIAGQYSSGSAGFFQTAWDTTTNKMTDNHNGTFTWEVTPSSTGADGDSDDLIDKGTIQFKVYKNPTVGDPDGDASYPTYAKSYKVKNYVTKLTFTYTQATHAITVTPTYKVSGWLYSGADPDDRTEVDVTSGMSSFDTSTTGTTQHGSFRFMWGKSDPGLDNALTPSHFKSYTSSNAYWVELTSSYGTDYNGNFFFGLANSGNKGNLVGKHSEDQINDSASNKTIKDADDHTLFQVNIQNNNDVGGGASDYLNIYGVDWTRITAIGVLAYDNGQSTNGTNQHGKVDYQFYYKERFSPDDDDEPAAGVTLVNIYAKDASLRDGTFNRFATLADTEIADDYFYYSTTDPDTGAITEYTSISDYNGANDPDIAYTSYPNGYGTSGGYVKLTNVPVGAKIKVKTTLSSDTSAALAFNGKAFKDTHYMKGYSFNGVTYQVNSWNNTGVYEEIWTVRAVNTKNTAGDNLTKAESGRNAIEVTPIYYMKDSSNCRTFYIDGYDGTVQEAWGNLLSVYPYYENISGKNNAFGGYPGQPMLFWGGKYQMEVPLTVDGTASGATVKGLTLHNSYWDLLHRDLDLVAKNKHSQTYDFDDFYKINKEKNPDTIIFDFKYATTQDNYGDWDNYTNYNFAGTSGSEPAKAASDFASGNGIELLTDYFGKQVDVFGDQIVSSGSQSDWNTSKSQDKELLIVSTGYKNTYVGEYSTIWAVYEPQTEIDGTTANANAGKFIGYISPSMLYLNNKDRVSQYTNGTATGNGQMSSGFLTTYNTLKANYSGVPALITYEEEIKNNSKDIAHRSDGKWYYSTGTDLVNANIEIQYGAASLLKTADKGLSDPSAWHNDTFDLVKTGVSGEHNIGSATGCSAYFTNTTPDLLGKTSSGDVYADSSKYFTFRAKAAGSYMFVNWVRYSNGKYYEISDSELAQSNMSANDTYIARFVESEVGNLTISHEVEQTATYTGTGDASVSVVVKNAGGTQVGSTLTADNGASVDISNYISSKFAAYTIEITLTTDPDDESESYMKEMLCNSGNFSPEDTEWNTGENDHDTSTVTTTVASFSVQDVLDSGITNLSYTSHLMKPTYTYTYAITYHYTSRFYGDQAYTVSGTFDAENMPKSAANMTGSKSAALLNTDFIVDQTPYEKNFRQKIAWNYTNEGANAMVNRNGVLDLEVSNTYNLTADVYSTNTIDDRVKAEIQLPYPYSNQESGYEAQTIKSYHYDTGNVEDDVEYSDEYIFDESQESVTIVAQAYKPFTYDGSVPSPDTRPSDAHLIEAAPYVWKDPAPRYEHTPDTRYFTSRTFKIGDKTYYRYEPSAEEDPDFNASDANTIQVTSDEAFNVTWKRINSSTGELEDYTLTYAVEATVDGKTVVYSFESDTTNVGQYTYHSMLDELSGFYMYTNDTESTLTGDKKYFTRWDIYSSDGNYVASSYNRRFNYSGYDNYIVKAIYESDVEEVVPAELVKTDPTILYLGDTRNQWNNDNKGTASTEAGDKLLHDFAISFDYYGDEIREIKNASEGGKDIRIGMIIEQVSTLDVDGSRRKISKASYYADKYKTGDKSFNKNAIETALAAGTNPKATTGLVTANSKIASNVAGWGSLFTSTTGNIGNGNNNIRPIDNMNRLQWYYTFNNTKTEGVIGEGNNANFVYRASAYIIETDSNNVKTATVSSTPVYFTLYDSASR